jgi:AraC-like DNA-binding protein
MGDIGLTKARSMGPVADAVERGGGSVSRVFRRADLPLRLIDEPDRLIPLGDQLLLVECAAREIGDDALPARLSSAAGVVGLGRFGEHVVAAQVLAEAIDRTILLMGSMLQSGSSMELRRLGPSVEWTYTVTDRVEAGRQKNEILALGYMLDLVRRYAGPRWTPQRIGLPGPPPPGRRQMEDVFRGEISRSSIATLTMPAELLGLTRATPSDPAGIREDVPPATDFVACVAELARTSLLLDGRARIDWIARRLGMSRRSFQRRLGECSTTFGTISRTVIEGEAYRLLATTDLSVTAVALELGYSDPAHFSRAFSRWTGRPPRGWRGTLVTA